MSLIEITNRIEASLDWLNKRHDEQELMQSTCVPKTEGGDGCWEMHEQEMVRIRVIMGLLHDLKRGPQKPISMAGHSSCA